MECKKSLMEEFEEFDYLENVSEGLDNMGEDLIEIDFENKDDSYYKRNRDDFGEDIDDAALMYEKLKLEREETDADLDEYDEGG